MTLTEHYREAERLLAAVAARRKAAAPELLAFIEAAQTTVEVQAATTRIAAFHQGLTLDVLMAAVHAQLASIPVPVGGRS